jgi:tetratricopeptide (TPR) repeat protein
VLSSAGAGPGEKKKNYDTAIQDLDEAIRLDPKYAFAFYGKACVYALQGRTDPAIENLRRSLELGFPDFEHMAKDSDLDSIRGDPRYKQLVQKYAK